MLSISHLPKAIVHESTFGQRMVIRMFMHTHCHRTVIETSQTTNFQTCNNAFYIDLLATRVETVGHPGHMGHIFPGQAGL